jgi:hypothetical protein
MALDNINLLSSSALSPNSDKILLYRSGGLEASTTLLSLTNSALTLSGVYLDPVNQRVGIYNPSPSAMLSVGSFGKVGEIALHRAIDGGQLALLSAQNGGLVISGGGQVLTMTNNYTNSIGTTQFAVSGAMWGIKGSGSTSATTSLLVQNSASTQLLKVADDGAVTVQKMNVTSNYPSYTVNGVNLIDYGGGMRIGYDGSVTQITMYTNGGTPQLAINNNGQVSIAAGSANASAQLDVNSTTRGFLKPKMTTAQKNAIATPAAGLEVYDTDLNRPCFFNGTSWITL